MQIQMRVAIPVSNRGIFPESTYSSPAAPKLFSYIFIRPLHCMGNKKACLSLFASSVLELSSSPSLTSFPGFGMFIFIFMILLCTETGSSRGFFWGKYWDYGEVTLFSLKYHKPSSPALPSKLSRITIFFARQLLRLSWIIAQNLSPRCAQLALMLSRPSLPYPFLSLELWLC